MRRLFIMRKDLHMSPGKLAAQVGHCSEVYWIRWIKRNARADGLVRGYIDEEIMKEYVNGIFTKTVCEAKNKKQLMKAQAMAEKMNLVEDEDYGLIYDKCLTELEPEESNGTTLTGIWFKPLPDDKAHLISKKYQLFRAEGDDTERRKGWKKIKRI